MQFMSFSRYPRAFISALSVLMLTACGGSDDEESEYDYAYLQFYNASPNGASVTMQESEGEDFGTAQFGDATALYSLAEGEVDLEFVRNDADDQEIQVDTLNLNIREGQKTLVVMSGDFSSPVFTALNFERESLTDHFRLFTVGLMADAGRFDIYMSESGEPFEAANYVGTAENAALTELTFWDGDTDSDDFDTGEYTLFLTEPGGSEVVFESQTIDFAYSTEYVLALRDVSGAIKTGMRVDMVLNSTSVVSVSDVDAASQYRVYNPTGSAVKITFGGTSGEEEQVMVLEADSLSDFTAVRYGDYRVTAESTDERVTALNNKLVTLNQGESKAVMLYQSASGLAASTFIESGLPQAYDKTVSFVNLAADSGNVDIYLVRNDETIDTAEYSTQNLSVAEYASVVLPADYYEIIAVSEDDNGEQTLLDRTALYGFLDDENYIVTVEPADTPTGYQISVLH